MALGRFSSQAKEGAAPPALSDINMTPLIDVMLVLLVIFLVTAPLMLSSLRLQLPRTDAVASTASNPVLRVELDAQGRLWLNQRATTLADLQQAMQAAAGSDANTEVQLHADASVAYGRVAEVMGLANKSGLSRIGFVAVRKP
ncbi:biopolymer transporter ExbD [Curvibacter sp. CHRR-16]|uniref:ExbD/TolR family protein n=1 Tax=Curvibacter sp. CHRR-16 TaxID=2835872 RepID=UPI001BDAD067|nr:biopolymer transporter ExbD [Curvibacter sp. CHRR-16]MBT0570462.1 biopolymer transporter ExbD [Curvibacter sp. CHRR-16]